MAARSTEGPGQNVRSEENNGPAVIRSAPLSNGAQPTQELPVYLLAATLSLVIHAILLSLFLFVTVSTTSANVSTEAETITQVDTDKPKEANLTNPEEGGLDPNELLNYNIPREADVSVPGPVNPTENIGIKDMAEGPLKNVPPPPGYGGLQGGGIEALKPGLAPVFGFPGGMKGIYAPGGTGGRSGATREQLLREGGGNTETEAAVARGIGWIVRHQAPDGHWSLDGFNQHGRCNCTGYGQNNDIAATAFGLLPLLGAGETHKQTGKNHPYSNNVERAWKYLALKQSKDGYYGGGMYAHGLATIAMCELFGMTGDRELRGSCQRAINFIRAAQSESGGWRYEPREGGDTSVVGWQVMALKSGQMAELTVDDKNNPTLAKATKWLNSCMTADQSGYGYQGPDATPTMSAVGLLCRLYLGTGPRNSGIVAGVKRLQQTPPGSQPSSIYYLYYATQVMHHVGGTAWTDWNLKMRQLLLSKQEKAPEDGGDKRHPHLKGSWSPVGDVHGGAGGRLMVTSLAVLTLEVYYRHLPLYRRDAASGQAMRGE